jgi:DNA primase
MNRSVVEDIKSKLSIEDVIGSYIKLEKSGKTFKAKCPFHNEKTPSFFVSPDRGGYYCFGCGAKGDIFSFVEQFEGLDFKGALRTLADKAGVILQEYKVDNEKDSLYAVMEEAVKYFEAQFLSSNTAELYIKSRGINDSTRKLFRIGFAPLGWRNLHNHLRSKGYSEKIIEKAGLIKKKDQTENTSPNDSGYYDRFRGRVMFPISDTSGRIVAFSGRILEDDGKSAKYLNSPDTPLYDKSMVLYGLDKAKSEIRVRGYSILVEGQMDLVLSHQAGVRNTVASSGTALTDETTDHSGVVSNLGLIRRLSPNVIIAFDSDNAGRKAAIRAARIAISMGMEVKIASLPDGKDPADLVRDNIELWKEALKNAKNVVEFELENSIRNNSDVRKLSKALRENVFPFIAVMNSAMDQAYFIKMIADKCHITEDAVWNDLRSFEATMKTSGGVTPGASVNVGTKDSSGSSSRTSETMQNLNIANKQNKFDLLERRILGLLHLIKKANIDEYNKLEFILKDIMQDEYQSLISRTENMVEDFVFEAEAFFGDKPDKWVIHVKDLLFNFEKDLIDRRLMSTMNELRIAEKNKDSESVSKLAKICQELSLAKSKINKK